MKRLAAIVLSLAFGFCSAGPVLAEERVALVIANSAYSGGTPPLANPVNDARLIAGALRQVGFSVTLVTDADQKRMKKAVGDFGEALAAAGPKATALFYFAGHGLQVGGENFLVPVGANIAREGDVDLEAISADAVLKQMEYAAVATNIIILDACRNNPLSRSFRSATRGLARMDAPSGSFVAYSTAPGDVAADGDGRNSPFASALAREMLKPGQAIEETFRNVRIDVAAATGGQQTPWDSSSLMGSFVFAPGKAAGGLPVAAATLPDAGTDKEALFWESIRDGNDAELFRSYLQHYPDGTFASIAHAKLRELEGSAKRDTGEEASAGSQPAGTVPDWGPIKASDLPAGISQSVIDSLLDAPAFRNWPAPKPSEARLAIRYFNVSGTAPGTQEGTGTMSLSMTPAAGPFGIQESTVESSILGQAYSSPAAPSLYIGPISLRGVTQVSGVTGNFFPVRAGNTLKLSLKRDFPGGVLDEEQMISVEGVVDCPAALAARDGSCYRVRVVTSDRVAGRTDSIQLYSSALEAFVPVSSTISADTSMASLSELELLSWRQAP